MHQHTNKRRQIAIRSFTYGIMTAAVVIASVASILLVLGYQFNRSSGKVEQGSLLQLRSFPSDAQVAINGDVKNVTTPDKAKLSAGDYSVTMSKEGYNDWSKSIRLKPGELAWLNYTRLVPSSVSTEEIQEFPAVHSVLSSPNKNWIALQQTPEATAFDIYDIQDEKKPELKSLPVPEGVLPSKIDSAEIIEWDKGNKYFLVAYNKASAPEYVRIDRTDPKKAVNISKKLNIKSSEIHFGDSSGNVFFALIEGDVRKVNIETDTIAEPLVSGVTNFGVYSSDTVMFSAVDGEKRIIGTHKDNNDKANIVRTLAGVKPDVQVASSSYFGDDYLAFSNGSEVEIIQNPKSSKKVLASFVLKKPVQWLQFSTNGRFIVAQNGTEIATHDLEYGTTKHITLPAAQPPTKPVGWLDGYHLWSTDNNQVLMTDFDGSNQQIITDALPGFDVTLSSNGKQLFSIGQNKTTKKPILQSSQMVVEN